MIRATSMHSHNPHSHTDTLQYNTDIYRVTPVSLSHPKTSAQDSSTLVLSERGSFNATAQVMIWPFERRFASAQQPTTVSFFPIVFFICTSYKLPLCVKMEDNKTRHLHVNNKDTKVKFRNKKMREIWEKIHKNYIRPWNRLISVQSSRVVSGANGGLYYSGLSVEAKCRHLWPCGKPTGALTYREESLTCRGNLHRAVGWWIDCSVTKKKERERSFNA